MAKHYTVEKKIRGKSYVFQHNGISEWLKALDESYVDGTGNISAYKLNTYLLENVVVSPKMEIDDFANADELSEVMAFARKVASGKETPKKATDENASADKK